MLLFDIDGLIDVRENVDEVVVSVVYEKMLTKLL